MEAGTFWRREPDVKFSLDALSEQRMVAVPTGIEHAREIRKYLGVLRRQEKGDGMELVYPRCCGLDIHKASVTACVLVMEGAKRHKMVRRFGTATAHIQELAEWLDGLGVQQVAMEATGVYWKP